MGKQKLKKVKSNLVESLELPKDIMYGAVIVTATGKSEVLIENYKGILEYTNEKIRLQTKGCQVEVCGKCLLVEYYTNDEMKITGSIHQIVYDP
ncbi:MAG: sporulation protein [Lachnospiraceae bacterium]|nr:sporulation protein [Lachnospiraceae bacterium]